MEAALKLHACSAAAWMVVELAWVQRGPDGPFGYYADLFSFYSLGILPAVLTTYLLEARARKAFLDQHHRSQAQAGADLMRLPWCVNQACVRFLTWLRV